MLSCARVAFLLVWISYCVQLGAEQQDAKEEVIIAADRWCPYNCAPNSERPGYMVELAQSALNAIAPNTYRIVYRVMPWRRAIIQAEIGKIHGVIGAVPSEASELIFPREEQGQMKDSFFTLAESEWTFTDVDKIRLEPGFIIGGVDGYNYSAGISDFLSHHTRNAYIASGLQAHRKLLELLTLRRISAYVGNEFVFFYNLKELGLDKAGYRIAGSSEISEKLYIAFNSDYFARLLSEGTELIRESGELQIILQRYGLVDWK